MKQWQGRDKHQNKQKNSVLPQKLTNTFFSWWKAKKNFYLKSLTNDQWNQMISHPTFPELNFQNNVN